MQKFLIIMFLASPIIGIFVGILIGIKCHVEKKAAREAAGAMVSAVFLGITVDCKKNPIDAAGSALLGGLIGGSFGAAVGIATASEITTETAKFHVTYENGYTEIIETNVGTPKLTNLWHWPMNERRQVLWRNRKSKS